ncbi:ABC transporter ATP-binding protein, partial [Streptomyces sp. NEAU-H3]
LRLARPGADAAELRAALAAVGALEWVERLPEGLDTVVGEGGHRLTTDRAQQLALARLLLADPPLVVLDEATAEAGSSGARVLDEAAERALRGRTALVVAHRLGQAAAADRVVVMDAGRIVEQGTHEELLAAGGAYATLWRAWSGSRSPGESVRAAEGGVPAGDATPAGGNTPAGGRVPAAKGRPAPVPPPSSAPSPTHPEISEAPR